MSTDPPRAAVAGLCAGRLAGVLLRVAALLTVLGLVGTAPSARAAPATPWVLPLDGAPAVTRGFDPPPDRFGPGHRGVDLAGAPGRPVRAAGDGVVVFAGDLAGRPVVSIAHPDGRRTTYEPVQPSVAAGQSVARGSVVGTLVGGHAGCPAAACLHWGLRRGEVYLDPLRLLHPPRIRLLPWH